MKIDDIRASMTMGQPFPGVWLPRGLNIHSGRHAGQRLVRGRYERKFVEYRLAEVSTKMRVPKKEEEELDRPEDHGRDCPGSGPDPLLLGGPRRTP